MLRLPIIIVAMLAASGCGVLADSQVTGGRTDLSREVRTEPPRRTIRIRPAEPPLKPLESAP